MKNRILFAVLLVLIIIIGLNGTKITTAVLSLNNAEQSKISRSSVKSGAVYLSPDEITFDPMSMVNKEKSKLVSDENGNNIVYGDGRFDICDIIDSLIRNISIYSENAEYFRPDGTLIRDSVYAAPNDLYYVENYKYYNKSLNVRYVDLIISGKNLNIRYIRFYDEQKRSVSYEAVQQEIGKLNKMSTDFFSRSFQMDYYSWFHGDQFGDMTENGAAEYPDFYFDPYDTSDVCPSDYDGIYDYNIYCVCHETKNLYMAENGDNPMILFFLVASAADQVSFKHYDYYYDEFGRPLYDEATYEVNISISGAMPFVMECGDPTFINNMEFAAFDGKIYMTSQSYDAKKTIIYNVASHEIEGYCNNYNSDNW